MKKLFKQSASFFLLIICISRIFIIGVAAAPFTNATIQLNEQELALIESTQNGEPLDIGILPYSFPLSKCPPDSDGYTGMIIEMLTMITEISGLTFEYGRVPLETQTPYQVLQDGGFSLMAGTIKLDIFLQNPELVLSDRLCDGSAVCIAKRSTNPSDPDNGKIATLKGYQAGFDFAADLFPSREIVTYPNNQAVIQAVRNGDADLAILSRYVGVYELQSPLNEELVELSLYRMEKDSCVMGITTPQNEIAISIINKALAIIGEEGYNYMQMNFSLTHPYKLSPLELLYKYRYVLLIIAVAVTGICVLAMRLIFTQKEHKRLALDPLTGAFTQAGFELAAAKIIPKTSQPLFVTDFDVQHFSSYNELNGKEEGDILLKNIVKIATSYLGEHHAICRTYADHFTVLSCQKSLTALTYDIHAAVQLFNKSSASPISLNFGVYPVTDKTVPILKMLDFAAIAKKHIKENANAFIGIFDEKLLERSVREAKMTSAFQGALERKEFVAYYQPKFDSSKNTIVGAEALVRWKAADGSLIPPIEFIELFEKSGQIQQLDFYMLEQVCIFLCSLAPKNIKPLPIAVNFSRVHLYSDEFITEVNRIVEQYDIPKSFIEIECTETTMLNNIELTRDILGRLQDQGFNIAMDDFGSAYSSLNTLCSIPLDVIKLDRGFLMATLSHEKAKANIIISSVITLAHDLTLKVVAEGVETAEQYEFLQGLGCDFIQGFYFSRPLAESNFLKLLSSQDCNQPTQDF